MTQVAYFEDIAELHVAGQELLDDTALCAAVVRNVGEDRIDAMVAAKGQLSSQDLSGQDSPDYASAFYKAFPEAGKLDTVVGKWGELALAGSQCSVSPAIAYGWLRSNGRSLHFDALSTDYPTDGPLTLSIRTDKDPAARRKFFVQRFANLYTLDPNISYDEAHRAMETLKVKAKNTSMQDMVEVEQGPGDIVIIASHPQPTMHAVEVEQAKPSTTQSIVLSYCITTPKSAFAT